MVGLAQRTRDHPSYRDRAAASEPGQDLPRRASSAAGTAAQLELDVHGRRLDSDSDSARERAWFLTSPDYSWPGGAARPALRHSPLTASYDIWSESCLLSCSGVTSRCRTRMPVWTKLKLPPPRQAWACYGRTDSGPGLQFTHLEGCTIWYHTWYHVIMILPMTS